MNLTKRLAFLLAALLLFTSAPISTFADTIIDYVLYTDIRTYINGVEITSYNIKGNTAVIVEDLMYYGFEVGWVSGTRKLMVDRNIEKPVLGTSVVKTSGGKVGDKAMPVYATDIETYFEEREVESYNVGGRTIVFVDDLAECYASSYKWDPKRRTLKVELSTTFDYIADLLCVDLVDQKTVKANIDHFEGEGEENIFDSDPGTKWCTSTEFNGGKNEIIVEWQMTKPVILAAYRFITANDVDLYPGRNPKAWTLEAKKDKNSKWIVLSSETSAVLPLNNFTISDVFWLMDNEEAYQYYRLVITDNLKSIEIYQFSELKLYTLPDYAQPRDPDVPSPQPAPAASENVEPAEAAPVAASSAAPAARADELYNQEVIDKLKEYIKKNGDKEDFGYGKTFPFKDGTKVVLGYSNLLDCFFVNVFYPRGDETIEVSVWLFTFMQMTPLFDVDFVCWYDGEVIDAVEGSVNADQFVGYDIKKEEFVNDGLNVYIGDDDEEDYSNFFEALMTFYDTDIRAYTELLTLWGDYTNIALDSVITGASIADFGFINYG